MEERRERVAGFHRRRTGGFRQGVTDLRVPGWDRDRGLGGRLYIPDLAHHLAHVILDAFQKRFELRFAAMDACEISLPLAGHRRALHLGMHDLDEPDPLVGRFETPTAPDHIAALEQHLDDGGARRRRAQAGLLHCVRKFLLVECLARRLHRRQQGSLRETLWWSCLLPDGLNLHHFLRVALLQAGRQDLFRLLLIACGFAFPRIPERRDVQRLPAHLLHRRARCVIAIDNIAVPNSRDHRGHRPDVIVMPGTQQAAANQVVDPAFLTRQPGLLRRRRRRNDGVVISDLGIVDEPPSQRTLPRTGRKMRLIGNRDRLDDLRQRGRHILRQMSAVRSRVADQLVPFIERLGQVQGLLRAEAEQPVGVPLQFRQIVQRRRCHPLDLGSDRFDGGRARARALDNPSSRLSVRRQPHRLL